MANGPSPRDTYPRRTRLLSLFGATSTLQIRELQDRLMQRGDVSPGNRPIDLALSVSRGWARRLEDRKRVARRP